MDSMFGHFVGPPDNDKSNKVKFVERVIVEVKGGKGGNGCVSHEVLSPGKKRPNGGNGGRGGNVYVVGTDQLETLHFPTYHFNAGNGNHGGSAGMTGRRGKDVYIHVPLGTIVTENIPDEFADYFYYDDGPSSGMNGTNDDDGDDGDGDGDGDGEWDEAALDELMNEGAEVLRRSGRRDLDILAVVGDEEEEEEEEEDDIDIDMEEEEEENEDLWAMDSDAGLDSTTTSSATAVGGGDDGATAVKRARRKKKRRRKRGSHFSREKEEEQELLPALRREIMTNGETHLIATGGDNGIGNKVLAGSSKHRARSLPVSRTPGRPGEQRSLILELKLIADVGLVGYPNAGKSTLLRQVSNAKPKVAPYHFTTLRPYLGVLKYDDDDEDGGNDGFRVTFADIPGLIDGAHADRGLGHTFLKHIERTKVLLYVLDGAATEGRDPADDLLSLMEELRLYNANLMNKPALVFANKADLSEWYYRNIAENGGDDDDDSDSDSDGDEVIEEDEEGNLSIKVVHKNVNGLKKQQSMSKLERVAMEAGLTVVDGSANSGTGIGELAALIRDIIQTSTPPPTPPSAAAAAVQVGNE